MQNLCYNGRLTKVSRPFNFTLLSASPAKEAPETTGKRLQGLPYFSPITERNTATLPMGQAGERTLTAGNDLLPIRLRWGFGPRASGRGGHCIGQPHLSPERQKRLFQPNKQKNQALDLAIGEVCPHNFSSLQTVKTNTNQTHGRESVRTTDQSTQTNRKQTCAGTQNAEN